MMPEPRPGLHILAGVLIGASVALKLTNVVFAFGLVAAAIAATRPLAALGCVALGGAIVALAALTGLRPFPEDPNLCLSAKG
jgi:hypothetical protein